MGFNISNFTDNDDVRILDEKGMFKVIEYIRDLSCTPSEAQLKYFMTQQGVRKKQLVIELDDDGAILRTRKNTMDLLGNVSQTTGLKGVGELSVSFSKDGLLEKVQSSLNIKGMESLLPNRLIIIYCLRI